MSKLVFVHDTTLREDALLAAFNDSCIVKRVEDDSATLDSFLENIDVSTLSHVSFVWHYPGYSSLPLFYDPLKKSAEPVEGAERR